MTGKKFGDLRGGDVIMLNDRKRIVVGEPRRTNATGIVSVLLATSTGHLYGEVRGAKDSEVEHWGRSCDL